MVIDTVDIGVQVDVAEVNVGDMLATDVVVERCVVIIVTVVGTVVVYIKICVVVNVVGTFETVVTVEN